MARNDRPRVDAREAAPSNRRDRRGERSPASASSALPWLLKEKVTVPDRVAGYYHRQELLELIHPTGRRATVLKAPGGFGKTILLAESCRRLKESGALTAWLTLDVRDAPHVLEAYLAVAFQVAGLDVLDGFEGRSADDGAMENRIDVLLQAIARYGGPCVLALDELERVADPDSLTLMNFLLQWGPPNLALAIACRELPAGFDIGSSILEGRSALFQSSDLRFSNAEIAGFIGTGLSRRELASLVRESRGWPIALRIIQNERGGPTAAGAAAVRDVAENWVESRLWRGLTPGDRDLLLDLGLFEWIDGALLDEVLDGNEPMRRVVALPALAGLVESVRVDGTGIWRLHPLIREHCARRRFRETPERFQSVHRRIAEALARRGETVAAMYHAAESGDKDLIGRILEDAGALRLWLLEGVGRLQSADRFLTADIRAKYPRLALAHCVVLMTTGRIEEARRAYRALTAVRSARATPPDTGQALELELEDSTVRGMLCLYGCERFGSQTMAATLADCARFAAMPEVDAAMRASFELGLCIASNLKAEFDAALGAAGRAERGLGGSPYIRMFVDLYRGQVAMAQGRVMEAVDYYASAYRIARTGFLRDPGQVAFVEVFMRELDLERNRLGRLERVGLGIPKALFAGGTPLASFAAASETAVELTLMRKGRDAALAALDEMREFALESGLPALVRYLAGLHVSLLAAAGRVGEAERAWQLAVLPAGNEGCLALDGQSWREMESLACARLRLLVAGGRLDAAASFAAALLAVAAERGLRRTSMRGLVLSVALERAAGRPEEAEARLVRFLHLFAETDYAGSAVRERAVCQPVLEGVLAGNRWPELAEPAERLLGMLRDVGKSARASLRFSARELEILEHLGVLEDKQIAAVLGLSVAGVRYHLARIFVKLGVNDRLSAVDCARRAGVLSASRERPEEA